MKFEEAKTKLQEQLKRSLTEAENLLFLAGYKCGYKGAEEEMIDMFREKQIKELKK